MSNLIAGPFYGAQRILTVYDDYVELKQMQNFRSFLTNDFLNGDKDIFYCDMISCQYKEGSSLILGYLQFETAGQSNRGNFGSENSFTFESKYNQQIYNVYQYIKNRIREVKMGPRNIQISIPEQKVEQIDNNSKLDELIKMKELLDQNIITKEEFDQFKKQILGLSTCNGPTEVEIKPQMIDVVDNDQIIDVQSRMQNEIESFDISVYDETNLLTHVGKPLHALNNFEKYDIKVEAGTTCYFAACYGETYQVMVDGRMLNMTRREFIYTFMKKD